MTPHPTLTDERIEQLLVAMHGMRAATVPVRVRELRSLLLDLRRHRRAYTEHADRVREAEAALTP